MPGITITQKSPLWAPRSGRGEGQGEGIETCSNHLKTNKRARFCNSQFTICNLQFAIILLCLIFHAVFAADKAQVDRMIPLAQVVTLPVEDDPTVCFRLWLKAGSQNDPPGKEGLAALTAAMITEASTKSNSYEQILDRLFPLAGSYDSTVSVEMTVISGRIHKDNLDKYYPLLIEAIREPAFRQDDLDRLKSEALNYLENILRYSSDEELGKAVLYNTIFRGTPYGHLPVGTIQSLQSLTVEDVNKFYHEYYTSDNVIIGLGGGYDQQLLEKLRADLAALPLEKGTQLIYQNGPEGAAHKLAASPFPRNIAPPAPPKIKGLYVTIVEKECSATAISMGFPINVLRGEKDWYALALANSWLGEHRSSSSHLYKVIREVRGLNYGDYSYIEHFPNGGALQMPPVNVPRRRQIFEIWIRPVPNVAAHFALRGAPGIQITGRQWINAERFRANTQLPLQLRAALRPFDYGTAGIRVGR